jgi:hypothetical protein
MYVSSPHGMNVGLKVCMQATESTSISVILNLAYHGQKHFDA